MQVDLAIQFIDRQVNRMEQQNREFARNCTFTFHSTDHNQAHKRRHDLGIGLRENLDDGQECPSYVVLAVGALEVNAYWAGTLIIGGGENKIKLDKITFKTCP